MKSELLLVSALLIAVTLNTTYAQDSPQWHLPEGVKVRLGKGNIHEIQYSPVGTHLAIASDIGIWIYDAHTGEELDLLTGSEGPVKSISFSPNGQTLASASRGGNIRLWDANAGAYLRTLTGHPDGVESIVFSPVDGWTLVSEGRDGTILLWELRLVTTWGNIKQTAGSNITIHGHELSPAANMLLPAETILLVNYPNPFNPETWIPYQLAKAAAVTVSIYSTDGKLVRTLAFGHQAVGIYESRSRAAYWDGRNQLGEPVASGIYFYTLSAGDFTATRKMVIRK